MTKILHDVTSRALLQKEEKRKGKRELRLCTSDISNRSLLLIKAIMLFDSYEYSCLSV